MRDINYPVYSAISMIITIYINIRNMILNGLQRASKIYKID